MCFVLIRKNELQHISGKLIGLMIIGNPFWFTREPRSQQIISFQKHLFCSGPLIYKILEVYPFTKYINWKGQIQVHNLTNEIKQEILQLDGVEEVLNYWQTRYVSFIGSKFSLRVLTIHPSYATAISTGVKFMENRSRSKNIIAEPKSPDIKICKYCVLGNQSVCRSKTHYPNQPFPYVNLTRLSLNKWEKAGEPSLPQLIGPLMIDERNWNSLKSREWYSGKIIDAWCSLLQYQGCIFTNRSYLIFSTSFFEWVSLSNTDATRITRHIRKVKLKDGTEIKNIKSYDMLIIPVNPGKTHWSYFVLTINNNQINYHYIDGKACPTSMNVEVK